MTIDPSFYSATVENQADGVAFVDEKGKIVFWNPGMETLTGYRLEEAVSAAENMAFLQIEPIERTDKEIDSVFMGAFLSYLKPGEALTRLKSKKGESLLTACRTIPVRNSEGINVGSTLIFRDVRFLYDLHAQLLEWEKRASFDFLTELPNRSYIEMNLRSRLYEYRRNGWPFGILLMDIDFFKKFNDEHGHDAGDAVLKKVASTLARHSRPYDVIGRWGGEEFLGVATNVDKLGLYSWAERLRYLVQKNGLQWGETVLRVTISVGASVVQSYDDLETLMKRVDHNLYLSKQNGRNRTTVDST